MQIISDPAAERALINCGFYNPQEIDLLDVHPYHFRNIEHQKIWEAMARQDTPDVVTVSAASGVPAHKINDILLDDVVYWNAKQYAEIIKKEYAGRIGAEIGSRILTDAHNGEDVRERVASYIRDLDRLTTVSGAGRKLVDIISDAVDDVLERVALIAKGEKVEVGYHTGIKWIDDAFGGMKKGWLVIQAGQPGAGKTRLAIQISKVFAKQAPGCFVILEGSEESAAYRFLEASTGEDATDIEFGRVDTGKVKSAIAEYEALDYEFFAPARLSISELRAYIAKQKASRNIGWIFVDYLSLLLVDGIDRNAKDEILANELRRICGEFDVLIWGLDSIVKSGLGKPLTMADIAGRLEKVHAADVAFGYSMYHPVKNIAPEIDPERALNCRLLGVIKDRHRGNTGRMTALEKKNGLIDVFGAPKIGNGYHGKAKDVEVPGFVHD